LENDFNKINDWLLPFSWLYGLGVQFRNFCYDVGLLKSHAFHVPVISVGNITVGGTGKTPHVEYLVRLLEKQNHVAVLSRGYKRKTRGFLVADDSSTARDIGDEPYQIKMKFPQVTVAVDGKRVRAINTLTAQDDSIDAIILDDAFQHRQVKPGINILLVDYHRLIIYDKLLPAGRLREPLKGKDRADIVIVTKCPKDLKPMEFRVINKAMNLFPYQQLFFTTFDYDAPQPLFPQENTETIDSLKDLEDWNVLLLTGIASPRQIREDFEQAVNSHLTLLNYPDHHHFREKDIAHINNVFAAMPSPKVIITTEKDAARLTHIDGLSDEVRRHIYTLPIRVNFMLDQEDKFNENIKGYVLKNSRNSILAKSKDDHKSHDSHNTGNRPGTISFRNN
jgi:tetraacyldisaccharide 4'-kinase